jgi:hypothetical protein
MTREAHSLYPENLFFHCARDKGLKKMYKKNFFAGGIRRHACAIG